VLHRVKFWWNSSRRGVGQLYNVAGWVGLVVLVLGVAAGIAVPLVFNLSPWLTAVVLMGLFIVVVLEGAYRVWDATDQQRDAALAERDTARSEIERRFAAVRYALQISNPIPNLIPGPDTMDVQIGLEIRNNSDEFIRYEIESVSTVIDGKRSPDGPILTTTAIIPPHDINTFTPPPAPGARLNWQMGSLSLTVRYGNASGPPRYRIRWEYAVQAMRQPGSPQGQISRVNIAPVSPPEVEDI
jgi:hypothetical protein